MKRIGAEKMHADKTPDCSHVIRTRRNQAEIKRGYVSLAVHATLLAALGLLLFTRVFLITRASGSDMFPAVRDGDLLLGFRLEKEFLKNDVVVYEVDGKQRIGRILGKETDVVTLDDTGSLLVNGTVQANEILFPTYAKEGMEYPYQVPEGCVFILGDHRTQAEDSRDFGCIRLEDVKAKVITILRRRAI